MFIPASDQSTKSKPHPLPLSILTYNYSVMNLRYRQIALLLSMFKCILQIIV